MPFVRTRWLFTQPNAGSRPAVQLPRVQPTNPANRKLQYKVNLQYNKTTARGDENQISKLPIARPELSDARSLSVTMTIDDSPSLRASPHNGAHELFMMTPWIRPPRAPTKAPPSKKKEKEGEKIALRSSSVVFRRPVAPPPRTPAEDCAGRSGRSPWATPIEGFRNPCVVRTTLRAHTPIFLPL